MPGDQALRLQYTGESSNANGQIDLSDDEIIDVESSCERREVDFNVIIPDSLMEDGGDVCAEAVPSTPSLTPTTKLCDVPLSPSPISLSADYINISGQGDKERMGNTDTQTPHDAVSGQPKALSHEAADSGAE